MKGALNHVRFRARPLRPVGKRSAILFPPVRYQKVKADFAFEEFVKWRKEEVSPVKWIKA